MLWVLFCSDMDVYQCHSAFGRAAAILSERLLHGTVLAKDFDTLFCFSADSFSLCLPMTK